jgi:hypothetical protein
MRSSDERGCQEQISPRSPGGDVGVETCIQPRPIPRRPTNGMPCPNFIRLMIRLHSGRNNKGGRWQPSLVRVAKSCRLSERYTSIELEGSWPVRS